MNQEFIQAAASHSVRAVMRYLGIRLTGLSSEELETKRSRFGVNTVTREKKKSIARRPVGAFVNPFTMILCVLALVSTATDMIFPTFELFGSTTYLFMYFVCCPMAVSNGVLFSDLAAHFTGADLLARQAAYIGLFQAGWFVESMWSQTLVIHMIRTQKIPFLQAKGFASPYRGASRPRRWPAKPQRILSRSVVSGFVFCASLTASGTAVPEAQQKEESISARLSGIRRAIASFAKRSG